MSAAPATRRAPLAVLAAVLVVLGLVVVDPEPAGAERTYGDGPLASVLAAADQRKACGLTRDQLAAMMLAPTFGETGAPITQAPSPMTLSRWDTQAALWAFGDKATPYQKAFWHPGVGMWQFDSAGGWNLTAATAIDAATSAEQAASVMAQRWCQNPSRSYAWTPWYACATTSLCEDIYQAIYDGTRLRDVVTDAAVTSRGGMVERSCSVDGIGVVACFFVDPARAEGYRGFAWEFGPPTPITAPFYVYEHGGREYRTWLRDHSGYGSTVVASKPVTSDARRSLTWALRADLCDITTGVGSCGGPTDGVLMLGGRAYRDDPVGNLEAAVPGPASVRLQGWAIDPDTADPVEVHVYVDGRWGGAYVAGADRPDVAAAAPGYGAAHGIDVTLRGMAPGSHEVCVYAINAPPRGSLNTALGCRTAQVSSSPFGNLESVTVSDLGVHLQGWVVDPDQPTQPATVHLYVDGAWGGSFVASGARPDVGAAFPGVGDAHGFDLDRPVPAGRRTVCLYGINVGPGANVELGCTTLDVPEGEPFGNFEAAIRSGDELRVVGWAIDPDGVPAAEVRVFADGKLVVGSPAGLHRPDVGLVYPLHGPHHGFDFVVPAPAAGTTVCVRITNTGRGVANPTIGCHLV